MRDPGIECLNIHKKFRTQNKKSLIDNKSSPRDSSLLPRQLSGITPRDKYKTLRTDNEVVTDGNLGKGLDCVKPCVSSESVVTGRPTTNPSTTNNGLDGLTIPFRLFVEVPWSSL